MNAGTPSSPAHRQPRKDRPPPLPSHRRHTPAPAPSALSDSRRTWLSTLPICVCRRGNRCAPSAHRGARLWRPSRGPALAQASEIDELHIEVRRSSPSPGTYPACRRCRRIPGRLATHGGVEGKDQPPALLQAPPWASWWRPWPGRNRSRRARRARAAPAPVLVTLASERSLRHTA